MDFKGWFTQIPAISNFLVCNFCQSAHHCKFARARFFHLGFDNEQLVKKNYNAQTVFTWLLQCMSFNITLCSNLSQNWLCCLFEISKAKGKVVNSQKVHSPGQHAFRCRHLWLYKLFVRFNYDWLNAVPTKYYCQTRCSNHIDSNVTKNLKPMLKWNKQATRKQEKHILLVIHRTRYIQIIKIYNRITFFLLYNKNRFLGHRG